MKMKRALSRLSAKNKILFIFLWMFVSFFLLFLNLDSSKPVFPQWIANLVVVGLAIPVCYYAAFYILPAHLYTKRVSSFIGHTLLLAFINSVITYVIAAFIYHVMTGLPMYRSPAIWIMLHLSLFLVNIVFIAITCIIKIIRDHYFLEFQMEEIAKEKLNTELNFLRSQINPHFLFNIMNTIYFQIEKTNVEARLSVEKFSEMLRYQLYECTTDKIQITKELNYIKNYVAIQTLRMENETDIQLNIQEPMGDFWIAPFLILPIVENAFKHVSSFKDAGKNKIHITLKAINGYFYIEALNSYERDHTGKHLMQSGGLGIQNLKRRLLLLFPERHELKIDNDGQLYKTLLKLKYDN